MKKRARSREETRAHALLVAVRKAAMIALGRELSGAFGERVKLGEIVSLDLSDYAAKTITFRGRLRTLSKETREVLDDYVAKARKLSITNADEPALFISPKTGRRVTAKAARERINWTAAVHGRASRKDDTKRKTSPQDEMLTTKAVTPILLSNLPPLDRRKALGGVIF